MKLLLLGAGASFGASRVGNVRPPLVTGILPSAVKLGFFNPSYAKAAHEAFIQHLRDTGANPDMIGELVDSNAATQHLEVLTEFVAEHFDARPDQYESVNIDFERLFALTEAELLGYHGILRHLSHLPRRASPPDVLDLQIRLVLCGTLIAAIRDLRCDYHDILARWLNAGDVVVSFNYDLLMDRSLSATGSWFHDDGYGMSFTKHGRRESNDVAWRDSQRTHSAVKLLKPHGSLNWLYPRNSWDSVMNMSLQPSASIRHALSLLYCLEDIHPQFEDDYPAYEWWEKYDIEHDGAIFDLHTLLVPPSLSKPYRSYEAHMGPVWGAISEALLTRVEELFVIGYSLRADDIRTHWLLRKAARQADQLKRIVLVDPSNEVAARAVDLFRPKPVEHMCCTLGDFATLVTAGSV